MLFGRSGWSRVGVGGVARRGARPPRRRPRRSGAGPRRWPPIPGILARFLQACAWLAQNSRSRRRLFRRWPASRPALAQVHWMLARIGADRSTQRCDRGPARGRAGWPRRCLAGVLAWPNSGARPATQLRRRRITTATWRRAGGSELMAAAQALAHDRPARGRTTPAAAPEAAEPRHRGDALAELGLRVNRNEQAQVLLERCLALAPGFRAARRNLARWRWIAANTPVPCWNSTTLLHDEPGRRRPAQTRRPSCWAKAGAAWRRDPGCTRACSASVRWIRGSGKAWRPCAEDRRPSRPRDRGHRARPSYNPASAPRGGAIL